MLLYALDLDWIVLHRCRVVVWRGGEVDAFAKSLSLSSPPSGFLVAAVSSLSSPSSPSRCRRLASHSREEDLRIEHEGELNGAFSFLLCFR